MSAGGMSIEPSAVSLSKRTTHNDSVEGRTPLGETASLVIKVAKASRIKARGPELREQN